MEKLLIEILNMIAIMAIVVGPFLGSRRLGILILSLINLQIIISFVLAFQIFSNGLIVYNYEGSIITGQIPIRMDYLSAWFIIIINFTFLTGAWYGIHYMKKYIEQRSNLILHGITFILVYTALINICITQNAIVFLVMWEIMALGSFMMIIFEHYKKATLKAGINFLIQSHFSMLFLTIAFIWIKVKTGSFDFEAITTYTALHPAMGIGLFVILFIGFAIKAGFVPFHTWLPLAHPAAPAHISGIMSGVIIKIGIYGILRMILLIKTDLSAIGYFIIIISSITGVYGVMLAIVQHNLKKLLAYHSIENIGIIGIGIGLGCLGTGVDNPWLVAAGFGGALLHTLNHSLFKSLLFFSAGNIYQATNTMSIESLGGLMKRMPRTSVLFLIGSLAICGLPPFNGFISEFFIYSGLFKGFQSNDFIFIIVMLFTILAMVMIGGFAIICFTKAFGVVFLGKSRNNQPDDSIHEKKLSTLPLFVIAMAIVIIGIAPFLFSSMLKNTVGLYQLNESLVTSFSLDTTIKSLVFIGWYSLGFIVLTTLFLFIRHRITLACTNKIDNTWNCGYIGDGKKMQYSASSFIRTYRKLSEPILFIKKDKKIASGIYPGPIEQVTHPYDKIEFAFIDKPIQLYKRFLNNFLFLQNGNIQSYILYGFIFIIATILIPIFISKINVFINFLNQL